MGDTFVSIYYGLTGKSYNIGEVISSESTGAEGDIHSVVGNNFIVAKIYHEENLSFDNGELEKKLKLMVKKKMIEKKDFFSIAWPRDLLYEEKNGKKYFSGYTMRRVAAKFDLYDLIHINPSNPTPDGIKGYVSWGEYIQAAYNLCCVIEVLHANGVEIGDFNEHNFLFDDNKGSLHLIDCGTYGLFDTSSFQSIYPCRYSMPQYTAPERLLNINVSDPRYTDYFYLAIHLFHLLMNNSDPFSYKEDSNGAPLERRLEHIANGDCLYVKSIPGKKLKKHSVKPGVLPDDILEAFNRTFNYTKENLEERIKNRTTATEWCDIFERYLKDDSKLVQCTERREHVYSAHLSECPWCHPETVSDIPYELRIKTSNKNSHKKSTVDITPEQLMALLTPKIEPIKPLPVYSPKGESSKPEVLAVQHLIDSIGEVTYSEGSKKKIREARIAYSNLPVEDRTKVSTNKLIKAEDKYEELKKNRKKITWKRSIFDIACILFWIMCFAVGGIVGYRIQRRIQSDTIEYLNNSISELNAGMEHGKFKQVVFGNEAVYCLNNDGSIEVYATTPTADKKMEKTYSSWKDVKSITVLEGTDNKKETIFGLKNDGSVLAPTENKYEVYDVSDWNNVVCLDTSVGWLMAVTSDGTVLSSEYIKQWGDNKLSCNCVSIAGFSEQSTKSFGVVEDVKELLALTKDGKVISILNNEDALTYYNGEWGTHYKTWENVKDLVVCQYSSDVYALTQDGTIKYGGVFDDNEAKNVGESNICSTWKDVCEIAAGNLHMAALKSNGIVLTIERSKYDLLVANEWKDIVHIEAFSHTTVGYASDGRIYYVGRNCLVNALQNLEDESSSSEITTLSESSQIESAETTISASEYWAEGTKELREGISQNKYKQVVFGSKAVYCLNNDGTISVFANDRIDDKVLEEAYSEWTDIDSIYIKLNNKNIWGNYETKETLFGIKTDGTVAAPTGSIFEEYNVSTWENVVKLYTATTGLLGITTDGTVLSTKDYNTWEDKNTKYNCYCRELAIGYSKDDWYEIVVTKGGQIAPMDPQNEHLPDLYLDGNFVSSYTRLKSVKDIVTCQESCDMFCLTTDGKVHYAGGFIGFDSNLGKGETSSWNRIIDIESGNQHIVALREDGTVYAHGSNAKGECDVSNWKNIVRIEAYRNTTVGYASDGSIYVAGETSMFGDVVKYM